jgi:hypothetical protein
MRCNSTHTAVLYLRMGSRISKTVLQGGALQKLAPKRVEPPLARDGVRAVCCVMCYVLCVMCVCGARKAHYHVVLYSTQHRAL